MDTRIAEKLHKSINEKKYIHIFPYAEINSAHKGWLRADDIDDDGSNHTQNLQTIDEKWHGAKKCKRNQETRTSKNVEHKNLDGWMDEGEEPEAAGPILSLPLVIETT